MMGGHKHEELLDLLSSLLNKSYKARRAINMGWSFFWISSKRSTFDAKLLITLDCSNAARAQKRHELLGVSNFHVWHTNLKVPKSGFIFLSYVRVLIVTGPAHAHSNHVNIARALHRKERAHMHRHAGSFLGKVVIKHAPYRENRNDLADFREILHIYFQENLFCLLYTGEGTAN
jgi:hypothetical protein